MENNTDANEKNAGHSVDDSRRDFVKKASYVAPVALTLSAMPSFAQVGSGTPPTDDPSFN